MTSINMEEVKDFPSVDIKEETNCFSNVEIKEETSEDELKVFQLQNDRDRDLAGGSCPTSVGKSTSGINAPEGIKFEDYEIEIKDEISETSEQSAWIPDDTKFSIEVDEELDESKVLGYEDLVRRSEDEFPVLNHEGSCKIENGELYTRSKCSAETNLDTCQAEPGKVNNFRFEVVRVLRAADKHYANIKLYKCHNCTYETRHKSSLTIHMKMLHDANAKLFKCNKCSHETKYKSALADHMKRKHAKLYKCEHCPYQTKDISQLIVHEKMPHDARVKLHKCNHCPYQTNCKPNLTQHEKMKHDANAKLYKCNNCPYETKYKSSLRKHDQVMHGANVKLYKCNTCMYETKYKCNLVSHGKIHLDANVKL